MKQLKERVRQLETALAAAPVELAVEREFMRLACQRAGITDVGEFPKKRLGSRAWALARAGQEYGVRVTAVCERLGMSGVNYYARRGQRQPRTVAAGLIVELLLRPLPPDYPCTTNSYHCLPVHRNRIKDLVVQQPNEVWVADLTYVRTEEGFLYLSLLTDKYLRKIAGYACGENLAMAGRVAALAMAVRELPAGAHPISHFDQGVQYCSHEYAESLAAGGLTASMTEKDHCAKNALAERMNGILKSEYGLGQRIQTKAQPRSGSIHPQLPIQY